jgi:hypothetical protein
MLFADEAARVIYSTQEHCSTLTIYPGRLRDDDSQLGGTARGVAVAAAVAAQGPLRCLQQVHKIALVATITLLPLILLHRSQSNGTAACAGLYTAVTHNIASSVSTQHSQRSQCQSSSTIH